MARRERKQQARKHKRGREYELIFERHRKKREDPQHEARSDERAVERFARTSPVLRGAAGRGLGGFLVEVGLPTKTFSRSTLKNLAS